MVATVGVLIATPAAALPLVLSIHTDGTIRLPTPRRVLEHLAVSAELERVEQRYQLISFVSDIVPKCPPKQLGSGSGPRRYCRQPATVAQWRNLTTSIRQPWRAQQVRFKPVFLAQNQTGADTSTKTRRACVASGSSVRQGLGSVARQRSTRPEQALAPVIGTNDALSSKLSGARVIVNEMTTVPPRRTGSSTCAWQCMR
jgi:hypothetical protein